MTTGPSGPETRLTIAEMKALLSELNAEREQDPPNIGIRPLQSFIDLLSAALP